MEDPLVRGMVILRALSALIEVAAVAAMVRLGRLEPIFRLNAALGVVGPTVFLLVSALGLAGLAGRLPLWRYVLVAAGVVLVLVGTRPR